MPESSLPAPLEGIPPWPGILQSTRRAMRGAADRRSWKGPLLLMLAVPIAVWALGSQTGAPPPKHALWTGHPLGDIALGWGVFALVTIVLFFGFGRLVGGRATLAEVFIVGLWSHVPWLVLRLPLDGLGLALHGPAWWSMESWLHKPSALFTLPADVSVMKSLDAIVACWAFALGVVGLSEVHRMNAGRVLLLLVVPLFLLGAFAAIAAAVLVAKFSAPGG